MIHLVFAAALAVGTVYPVEDRLPHYNDPLHPVPQKIYQQFRDRVILAGKCPAYEDAETLEEENKALDACWLDFIAPHL